MTDRRYLRARDMSSPAKAVAKRDRIISDWHYLQVQTALGLNLMVTRSAI